MSSRGVEYDAVVVGAGPNGLAAAVTLARAGRSVLVLEAEETVGGGSRTAELTLPGFRHDVCSSIHPTGVASPFFQSLPLGDYGLEWVHPSAPLAHPLDGGRAAVLERSLEATADGLGPDGPAYRRLMRPLVDNFEAITTQFFGPLRVPRHPLPLARFGLQGAWSATSFARFRFTGAPAQGLFAGVAAHGVLPLTQAPTAGFGLLFLMMGHAVGWPAARGGSQAIADALAAYLRDLGGVIQTGHRVERLDELPPASTVLCDVTPRQLLRIAGQRLPGRYRRQLERFRYGPGVFKIDWALDAPVPWTAPACARAATVHVGGPLDEVAAAEAAVARGDHPERPFVLLAQQGVCDGSRAPDGQHAVWAYCHVPNGSTEDMTARIEAQVERFAPGFADRILARHVMDTAAMEAHNANYIGGDIGGGATTLRQLFARPALRVNPYTTPVDGLYLCSASTPPGGGVHGMCGWWAARAALRRMESSRAPFLTSRW